MPHFVNIAGAQPSWRQLSIRQFSPHPHHDCSRDHSQVLCSWFNPLPTALSYSDSLAPAKGATGHTYGIPKKGVASKIVFTTYPYTWVRKAAAKSKTHYHIAVYDESSYFRSLGSLQFNFCATILFHFTGVGNVLSSLSFSEIVLFLVCESEISWSCKSPRQLTVA